jgi:hypothetical protein
MIDKIFPFCRNICIERSHQLKLYFPQDKNVSKVSIVCRYVTSNGATFQSERTVGVCFLQAHQVSLYDKSAELKLCGIAPCQMKNITGIIVNKFHIILVNPYIPGQWVVKVLFEIQ